MVKYLRILAVPFLIALVLFAPPPCTRAQIQPDLQVKPDPPIKGSPDLARCVRIALQQSPYLTADALNIDVKRLDVSDAKYAYVPSFSLRTFYYLNPPSQIPGASFSPYVVQFATEAYNPIEVYFNLELQKRLTRIAILAHCQIISDYIQRLAVGFLQLDSIDHMVAIEDKAAVDARQMLAYTKNRVKTGAASLAEVQIAEQELQVLTMDKKRLAASRVTITEGIGTILGLDSTNADLELDLKNARSQVLNDFTPAAATLEQAKSNSFELKIQDIRKEIQKKSVTLAYLRFLPHLIWGVQTADPLSGRDLGGLFFTVGLEMPIWDGMKRYHDISRQKILLKQDIDEGEAKNFDLAAKWRDARQQLENAVGDLRLAEASEKLSGMKVLQAQIKYREGSQQFSDYLGQREAHLDSQKKVVEKELEYYKAVLNLRALSGDLFNHFVSVKSSYEKAD